MIEDYHEKLQKLPRVHKSHLVVAPPLMEYICLNNPLSLEKYAGKTPKKYKVRKGSIDDSPTRKSSDSIKHKIHRGTHYNLKEAIKNPVNIKIIEPESLNKPKKTQNYF